MPKKKSHDKSHDPSQSANDSIPVDAAFEENAGAEASHGGYQGLPENAMADEPPYAAGGVGGRPSPRAADEPWSPTQGGPSQADFQPAAPADVDIEYVEITETVIPVTQDPRQIYIESMKANLEERGIDIDVLKAKAEGADESTRGQYLQQIASLQDLQDRASEMLQSLSETGESAWNSVAENLDKAYENLRSGLDSVMSRFRSEK